MVVFHIPQKTTLEEELCGGTFTCKNGSVCKEGDGEVDHRHQHLGLLSSVTSNADGLEYHCECPPGFIGHDCSVQVKECTSRREDLVHSCYFGSECIEADNDYGLLDKFCDCSRAHTEDGTIVAGLMCQYAASEMCIDDDTHIASTSDAYCTNAGKCKSIVSSDKEFRGCECEEGKWGGHHCEFADGVLKDDALDLFSVRKAEILYEENLHGLGLTATSITSDTRLGRGSFNFTSFGVGFGTVFGVGVSLLLMFVVRRIRKDKRKLLVPEDDYKCFMYDGQVPPPNVFASSRKKEVDVEEDDESAMMLETPSDNKRDDSVEMLDEATSRILESQFRRTEEDEVQSNEEELGLGEDFASPSYYDHDDEAMERRDLPRITINSGHFPLSSVADELPTQMSSVMSLDGGDDTMDDCEHANIMSLDGSCSEEDDDDSACYV